MQGQVVCQTLRNARQQLARYTPKWRHLLRQAQLCHGARVVPEAPRDGVSH